MQLTDRLKTGLSLHYMNSESPCQNEPLASCLFTPAVNMEYTLSKDLWIEVSGYYSKWSALRNNERNEIASPALFLNYSAWQKHNILLGSEFMYRKFTRKRVAAHDREQPFSLNDYQKLDLGLSIFIQDSFLI
ncbi:hypothetical protein GF407_06945 [candidate division KSB1 bacterium]|nr:hypothetical protein [candidate division KSB1 bacterium]